MKQNFTAAPYPKLRIPVFLYFYFGMHLHLIRFFLFLLCFPAVAQQLPYKRYAVEDGLASSVVYDILQDSKGFIWLATDAGLCKFNGTYFTTYTTREGLSDNDVLNLYEDSKGRIWLLTFSGIPSYILNEKIYSFRSHPEFRDFRQNSLAIDTFEDRYGNIWISTISGGIIKFTGNNVIRIGTNKVMHPGGFYKVDTDENIWINSRDGYSLIKGDIISSKPVVNSGRQRFANMVSFAGKTYALGHEKKEIVLATDSALIPVMYSTELFSGTVDIHRLTADGDYLWACTSRGAIRFSGSDLSAADRKYYLEGKLITDMLRDKEGNLWFATLGEGLYFLPGENMLNYTVSSGLPNDRLTCIAADTSGNIWLGTLDGSIIKFNDKKNISAVLLPSENMGGKVYDILIHSKGSIYCGGDRLFEISNDRVRPIHQIAGSVKSIARGGDNYTYTATSYGVFKVNGDTAYEIGGKYGINRAMSVFADKQNVLWIGTHQGFYSLKNDSMVYYGDKYSLLRNRIIDIESSGEGALWIATHDKGIVRIKDEQLLHITRSEGLLSDICNDIFIDSDDNIWLATNRGLSKISVDEKNSIRLRNYTSNDGLPGDEVSGVYKSGNKIWAATLKGLSIFEEEGSSSIPPPVYITSVEIDDTLAALRGRYELSYKMSDLKIRFIGLSYKSRGNIRYRYKMEGLDKDWSYTNFTEARYPTLPPGEYIFRVIASNKDGVWSAAPAEFYIIIHPPVWQTWWFRTCGGILLLAGIGGLFTWRARAIRKKEQHKAELQRRMAELKLTALRSQMNPHFIFNSLTSIRRFIHKNDEQAAGRYLTDFAHLLRMILNNSDREFVTLKEEIQILRTYLEFEALRFNDRFEYRISVDDAIDESEIDIPPLMIQPYVENAIQHGIAHLVDRKGILSIRFILENAILVCVIEDNGIGRAEAMKLKEQQTAYPSKGMYISRERLETLNVLKQTNMKVGITDIYDQQGRPSGTKVVIHIPVD